MLYQLKGHFQRVVGWMGGSWMTANQATIFGALFVFAITACFYFGLTNAAYAWLLLTIPLWMVLRLAMNALDGLISRRQGTASPAGEYMNEFSDILGDTISYGVLLFVPRMPMLPVALVVIASWACEFSGIMGKCMPGGMRRHDSLLGGKAERGVWFSVLALILYFKPTFNVSPYLLTIAVLATLTAALRVQRGIAATDAAAYRSFTPIGK